MADEAGLFEAFYASPVQHPILLWLAALAAFAWCAARPTLASSVLRYCAVLTVLSVVDAWLTSSSVCGLGALPAWAAGPVPLFFVLAGDYRYLLLLEAGSESGGFAPDARAFARAAGLTLVVPLFSQCVMWSLPASLAGPRVLFFVYELSFLVLVGLLWRFHPRLRGLPWLRTLSRFVLLYYGLWAASDAILLATGSDLGFALRVVPNLLYYGGLIAAIGWAASRARPPD